MIPLLLRHLSSHAATPPCEAASSQMLALTQREALFKHREILLEFDLLPRCSYTEAFESGNQACCPGKTIGDRLGRPRHNASQILLTHTRILFQHKAEQQRTCTPLNTAFVIATNYLPLVHSIEELLRPCWKLEG
eukprot:TRINITY_DN16143_c0_g1_i1.p1 TRINITY_DN16143_c0_g1~~TRINITY_DN16143_c0_g1_i1.p1  ORF type:complete len:135 (-),score=11.49 TRINITY_DN16143_c0_g1_i1:1084-1488(-)